MIAAGDIVAFENQIHYSFRCVHRICSIANNNEMFESFDVYIFHFQIE